MTLPEPVRNRWRQRAAVLFCVGVVAALWSVSQSDWALGNRVLRAGGALNAEPTAPDWVRETFGEGVAAWFDTPRDLYLEGEIPDGLLERAAEVESLYWLVLERSDVTDDGLAAFHGHPNLRGVRLQDTAITDRSFAVLESLPRLESISLSRTLVTPDGIAAFRKARPDVEIVVDAATEAGLSRYVAAERVSYSGHGKYGGPEQGVLAITGPVERDLVDSAKRLRFSELRLTDLKAAGEVARLVEGQPVQQLTLERIELGADAAAAFAERPLRRLSLTDVRITAEAAESLATLSLDELVLQHVAFDPGAAQALGGLKVTDLRLTGTPKFAPGDRFENLRVDRLTLDGVDLANGADPFTAVEAHSLWLNDARLDAAAASVLAGIPDDGLSLSQVEITGDGGPWLRSCTARNLSLSEMSLTEREAAALAALPLERLRLDSVTWGDGAEDALSELLAESVTIDALTSRQARELAASRVGRLWITRPIDGDAARELRNADHLTELTLNVRDVTGEDLAALAALPRLRHLSLTVWNPRDIPAGFWRMLAERHPELDLGVSVFEETPNSRSWSRAWPE